MVKGKDMVIYI